MIFAEHVEDRVMHLSDLRNKKVGDLIDFVHTRSDIEEFDFGDHDTSHNIKSRKGNNISNNMKLRCISAATGLVAGLVAACYLGQETLTLIGVSGVVLIAFAVVGALLGAGAGYVVGKCLDKIKVTNIQQERIC